MNKKPKNLENKFWHCWNSKYLEKFKIIMEHKNISKCSARRLVGAYQKGVTMIEYALIAALIAVVSVATITTLGTTINGIWQNISSNI